MKYLIRVKKYFKYLFLLGFVLTPFFSFASIGYLGSGAGSSEYNVLFCEDGTYGGYTLYTNDDSSLFLFVDAGGPRWEVSPTLIPNVTLGYYQDHVGVTTPAGFSWLTDTASDPPVTFTGDTCEDAPSEATTTTSTNTASTTEALVSIGFGLDIIIVLLFVGMTGYIWNKFDKRKKPWR